MIRDPDVFSTGEGKEVGKLGVHNNNIACACRDVCFFRYLFQMGLGLQGWV